MNRNINSIDGNSQHSKHLTQMFLHRCRRRRRRCSDIFDLHNQTDINFNGNNVHVCVCVCVKETMVKSQLEIIDI